MSAGEEFYLGRQPILDGQQRIQGFELLFRSIRADHTSISDNQASSAAVILRTLSDLGVVAALDSYPGFINCDASMLLSDAIELLPTARVVLEILETTAGTPEIQARCVDLRAKGFKLALDDFVGSNDDNVPLLPLVDIVKVDIKGMSVETLQSVTQELKPFDVILLAEKVETREEYERCLGLGFNLFQGYFFARPEIVVGKRMSTSQACLFRLWALTERDAETAELEQVFKEQPALGMKLLRLANTAAAGGRKLRSLADAIVVLGRRHIKRWLLLLMYAERVEGSWAHSPLLHLAATRGKLLEQLASDGDQPELAESAFLVGIISVMDALLSRPLPQIITDLELAPDLAAALLHRQGKLGELLNVADALEGDNRSAMIEFISNWPSGRGAHELIRAQSDAMAWANDVANA